MNDFSMWRDAPFATLTAHIRQRYHDTHRVQLDDLLVLAQKVNSVHAGVFPADILPLLKNIQAELLSHMMKEEQILFPMLDQGMGRGAAMPIRMMMHEHTEHEAAITHLLELTHQLTPPTDACGSWQRLYAEAQIFVNDLNEHMTLENEVLFARALAS